MRRGRPRCHRRRMKWLHHLYLDSHCFIPNQSEGSAPLKMRGMSYFALSSFLVPIFALPLFPQLQSPLLLSSCPRKAFLWKLLANPDCGINWPQLRYLHTNSKVAVSTAIRDSLRSREDAILKHRVFCFSTVECRCPDFQASARFRMSLDTWISLPE